MIGVLLVYGRIAILYVAEKYVSPPVVERPNLRTKIYKVKAREAMRCRASEMYDKGIKAEARRSAERGVPRLKALGVNLSAEWTGQSPEHRIGDGVVRR